MATPPRLVELKCPRCAAAHWKIDMDYRGIGGEDADYAERKYSCPSCWRIGAGHLVLQKSSPYFFIDPTRLPEEEFERWFAILKNNFPDHWLVKAREALSPVPLENSRPTLYEASLENESLLEKADFYFAVRAEMPEPKLIEGAPRIVRIGSRQTIEMIVNAALPGVNLVYTPLHSNFPRLKNYPEYDGFRFFKLDTKDVYWNVVKRDRNVCVRVPDEFPGLAVRLYADDERYFSEGVWRDESLFSVLRRGLKSFFNRRVGG